MKRHHKLYYYVIYEKGRPRLSERGQELFPDVDRIILEKYLDLCVELEECDLQIESLKQKAKENRKQLRTIRIKCEKDNYALEALIKKRNTLKELQRDKRFYASV